MKWTKLTITTTTQAEDLISAMLGELGIAGVEIEDKVPLSAADKERMFIDILPELGEDDGVAKISFYLEESEDTEAVLQAIKEQMEELAQFVTVGAGTISCSDTEDKDWINNWKAFFKPFAIDDTLWIKPTWEEMTGEMTGKQIIEIDPGTAFGTGSHETTKLCIINLKKYLKSDDWLLDVGCGSGILSIAGRLFGAGYVAGTDVDDNAVKTTVENVMMNRMKAIQVTDSASLRHYSDCMEFLTGNVISMDALRSQIGLHRYDVVVANILADIIIPLSEVAGDFMKPNGIFISSGIINTKQDAVEKALVSNGFEIVEKTVMGDWVSFVARKEQHQL